jgi:hypothetical protein
LERGEVCTGFFGGNLRERDHLESPRIDGRIILRWILMTRDVGTWTGLMSLRIGMGGGRALVNAVMNLRVP